MQAIKFRAWDKIHRAMRDVAVINWVEETVSLWVICGKTLTTLRRGFDEVVLLRFTGLQDRLGQEIYDSHIIKSRDGELYHVGYMNRQFYLRKRGSSRGSTFKIAELGTIVGSTFEGRGKQCDRLHSVSAVI